MTIDERLEKLAERHQALAETVEVIAGMQRKNEEGIQAVAKGLEALGATVKELAVNTHNAMQSIGSAVDTMAKSVSRNMEILIKYAQRHEDWLDEIEKRLDDGGIR